MSTNSITNSTNNSLNSNRSKNQKDEQNQLVEITNNHTAIDQSRPNNSLMNNEFNKTVRNSYSFASTTSTDSGCIGVNTSSMDASILSTTTNFNENESLMSCSIMTSNLFPNEDEEILTISHNNGEQIVNQMNIRNYIEQMNYNDDLKLNSSKNNVTLSSTCEDFSEMSSRAESQLSAIYQQIDELKSKIDEIDSDNGRIEAKMNSLVNFNNNNPKVNLGMKKNGNFNNGYNVNHFRLSNQSNYKPSSTISKPNQNKINYLPSNSSEEENNVTSSSYSPASSSSVVSSPTSIQNSSSAMNNSINCDVNYKQMNKLLDPINAMTSSSSFNSSISTNAPSSNWSLASICSSQNIPPTSTGCLMSNISVADERTNMSTIDENKPIDNSFSCLKQTDSSKLFTQLKYQKMLNGSTSIMSRKKSFNSKFLRRSFEQQQNVNRLSNGSLKNCNEAWVSTATDLLSSSDEEEDKTLNYVNNNSYNNCNEYNHRLQLPKFESKIIKPREMSSKINNNAPIERRIVHATSSVCNEFKLNLKQDLDHSKPNKPSMLLTDSTSYNQEKDALKFINNLNSFNELDSSDRSRQQESKTTITPTGKNRSQIPKPLTPFKTSNYKRLKPIKNSRIPIMKEAINENDVYESVTNSILDDHLYVQPPSPAPLDRYVNRIDTPLQTTKQRNLPKPSQLRLNEPSYLVSPLTQQLKFEKEQRKSNCSFRKSSYHPQYTHQKTNDLFSPPDSGLELLNSSEESYSDHSPLVEQQHSKNLALAHQIQNLRLELRDFKVAINEVRKDEII